MCLFPALVTARPATCVVLLFLKLDLFILPSLPQGTLESNLLVFLESEHMSDHPLAPAIWFGGESIFHGRWRKVDGPGVAGIGPRRSSLWPYGYLVSLD